jgi:hypothetical protein
MLNAEKALHAVSDLYGMRNFLPLSERAALHDYLKGEEADHFAGLVAHWSHVIDTMPTTGQQDALGENAIVHLHYFYGGADWFITEKDAGSPDDAPEDRGKQLQAFGWAEILPGCGEYGYISIDEVCDAGAELDLYWEPKTVAEAIKERGR